MAKWDRFPPGDAALATRSVFALAASSFKDLTGPTRVELFALIELLFTKYETVLKRDMGAGALVAGLVDMGAFEKTPSCIEVLFPLWAYISQNWNLNTVELDEIWDSFVRYFPVTLGGAKGPTTASKERMRDLLLGCFISNDHYAEKAFEICIAKLDDASDASANTKV
jgi:DNA repair/transcription protein MET18/MMS19